MLAYPRRSVLKTPPDRVSILVIGIPDAPLVCFILAPFLIDVNSALHPDYFLSLDSMC